VRRLCRRRRERIDSVTPDILQQRLEYEERLISTAVDSGFVKSLEKEGFGKKRKLPTVYSQVVTTSDNRKTNTGAGGFAQFMAAASHNWPVFQHLLPEIAFAGHSNCGKSTLVNAMIGIAPSKGQASVSDRAGWTDQICFYQLGKRPPVMTLVDLPGYGHAIASDAEKRRWQLMTRDFLGGSRVILSRCCVLIDCSRGVCEEDRKLLRFLDKVSTPWQIILTKGDLLTPEGLAQSIALVTEDLQEFKGSAERRILPVSSSTGAGVQSLWRDLKACVEATSKLAPAGSVREHIKAYLIKTASQVQSRS
jgi:GTP-binding protein